MPIPGVHVATLKLPQNYAPEQIERAVEIAFHLQRGKFVLAEPPERDDADRP